MTLFEIVSLFFIIIINFTIFKKFNFLTRLIPFYDLPNIRRKRHKVPVPVLGGIWVSFNFLIIILYLFFFNKNLLINSYFLNLRDILHFLSFLIIFLFFGLFDDLKNIKYKNKFILLIFFTFLFFYTNEKLIIYSLRLFLTDYLVVISLGKYYFLFTVFCLIFLLISLNFLDGINLNLGLFYLINILFLFFLTKNIFYLFLVIQIIFFLLLNNRSKVFLGDSGAFVISLILMYFYVNTYNSGLVSFDKIVVLFLYPIIDVIRVTIYRFFSNKNVFKGDRNHFHHILEDRYGNFKAIIILFLKQLVLIISSFFIPFLFILIIYILMFLYIFYYLKKNKFNF